MTQNMERLQALKSDKKFVNKAFWGLQLVDSNELYAGTDARLFDGLYAGARRG